MSTLFEKTISEISANPVVQGTWAEDNVKISHITIKDLCSVIKKLSLEELHQYVQYLLNLGSGEK